MMAVSLRSTPSAALLPLLQTLFDIALLRKGPQHLPRSTAILLIAVLFWLFAMLASVVLIDRFDETDFFREVLSTTIGVLVYGWIVVLRGRGARLLQAMSAIIGCGGLLAVFRAILYWGLATPLGPAFVSFLVYGFLLWSLSVKGHIIASAIDTHWYIGALIAVGVFSLQLVINTFIVATP